MEIIKKLIEEQYFKVSVPNSHSNNIHNLKYTQGENIVIVSTNGIQPSNYSGSSLKINVALNSKNRDSYIKIQNKENLIKNILNELTDTKYYQNSEVNLNIIIVQTSNKDLDSAIINAALMNLLKMGIKLKSSFWTLEISLDENNNFKIYNIENDENTINKFLIIIDVINNKICKYLLVVIKSYILFNKLFII